MTFQAQIVGKFAKNLEKERGKNKPWVTVEIIKHSDKKRELRHEKYTIKESRTECQKANRDVRKKMK